MEVSRNCGRRGEAVGERRAGAGGKGRDGGVNREGGGYSRERVGRWGEDGKKKRSRQQ